MRVKTSGKVKVRVTVQEEVMLYGDVSCLDTNNEQGLHADNT